MPENIFTARQEHIGRLSATDAVEFFRDLLWAEARRIGIPISSIRVSSRITVPDGGVDAEVGEGARDAQNDLIRSGHTAYQVKAGKSYEPWQDSEIKRELFGEREPAIENLGQAVRRCLENQGAYVLVCTGLDPTAQQISDAEANLKKYFGICGHNPSVVVLGQTAILGFVERFPSLSLRLKGLDGLPFQSHNSWSRQGEMRKEFKPGQAQTNLVSALQGELRRKTDVALHFHVRGEPGVGKTKLVLEATNADDLSHLVIYCDASTFRDSELINEILREDNTFSMIAVVDECDPNDRAYIWNRLANCGGRIKLVTIYNEFERDSGTTIHIDAPPLDDEHISAIIQSYGILNDQADRWAPLCGGSPRVAHVIGLNLRNNPEDLLRPPDTVRVWDRYICGGDRPDSPDVAQRRLVLQHIALFKRFGYGRGLVAEAKAIADRVIRADPLITWDRFQIIVSLLRERKVLQGENTLYITPKLLHIKLWVDWWDTHGSLFDLDQFHKGLPNDLVRWFNEMFQYAKESNAASRTVKMLLGPEGPFRKKIEFINTPLGSSFFLALTNADAESALRCLQKTVGCWNEKDLRAFTTGRRNIVWSLERIAMWRALFPGAARLLLSLGEAENENYSNNASGVFADLFSLGYGKLAPTEAPPEERLPVLEEAFRSESKERRALALKACDVALQTRLSRSVGAEYQGLREVQQPWTPKTYDELYGAYRQAWTFLLGWIPRLRADERKEAALILIRNAAGLVKIPSLTKLVLNTLGQLGKDVSNREELLTAVIRILHYEGSTLPKEIRSELEQLKDSATGSDFSSLLRRFVGMNLIEDTFDEKGERTDQSQQRIADLARQAFAKPEMLIPELGWLMSNDAKNAYLLGYELGKLDTGLSLLPVLLREQRQKEENASVFFLGGYFRSLFEKDVARWDAELDALAKDPKMATWVPELTWRAGVTDNAARRILMLAQNSVITAAHFRMFCLGAAVRDLSEAAFHDWISYLLSSADTNAAAIAVNMYDFFYLRRGERGVNRVLPEDLTFRLLTHPSLLQSERTDSMSDYHWTEVAKVFIQTYPNRSLDLAASVFSVEDGGILADFGSTAKAILHEIARKHPREIWQIVSKYLEPPLDKHSYYIFTWLQGAQHFFEREEEGVMSSIPIDAVWSWADRDPTIRAPLLAHYVPKRPFKAANQVCPRELLAKYGNIDGVMSSLNANFHTEGWSGPASHHYRQKREEILKYKVGETNPNVIRWLDECAESLEKQIEVASIEEERRGY